MILDLRRHDGPVVGHRLEVQEGFLRDRAARLDVDLLAEGVVLRRGHLQRITALGDPREGDDAAGVGDGRGHYRVGVGVQQLHRGAGQIGRTLGMVGRFVGDGDLCVALGFGNRPELERNRHAAVVAHHIDGAAVDLQRQIVGRIEQQGDGGLLPRGQAADIGGGAQRQPVGARRQLHLQRTGGGAAGIDDVEADRGLGAAQHAGIQIARIHHQQRRQRGDRQVQTGGGLNTFRTGQGDRRATRQGTHAIRRTEGIGEAGRAIAVERRQRAGKAEADTRRQVGDRGGHIVQRHWTQVPELQRAGDRRTRQQAGVDGVGGLHAEDVETVLRRGVGDARIDRIDRVVTGFARQRSEAGAEIAVAIGQRTEGAYRAVAGDENLHLGIFLRISAGHVGRVAGHLNGGPHRRLFGRRRHAGRIRRRHVDGQRADVVALVQFGHRIAGVGDDEDVEHAGPTAQPEGHGLAVGGARRQRSAAQDGGQQLIVTGEHAVVGKVDAVLPGAIGSAQAIVADRPGEGNRRPGGRARRQGGGSDLQVGQFPVGDLQTGAAAVEAVGGSHQGDVLGAVLDAVLDTADQEGRGGLTGVDDHRGRNRRFAGVVGTQVHRHVAVGRRIARHRGQYGAGFGDDVGVEGQAQGRTVVVGDQQRLFDAGGRQRHAGELIGDGGADDDRVVAIGGVIVEYRDVEVDGGLTGGEGDEVRHPHPPRNAAQRNGQRIVADDGAGQRAVGGGGAGAFRNHALGEIQRQRRNVVVLNHETQASRRETGGAGTDVHRAIAFGDGVIHRRDLEGEAALAGRKGDAARCRQLVRLVVGQGDGQCRARIGIACQGDGQWTMAFADDGVGVRRDGGGHHQRRHVVVQHRQGGMAIGEVRVAGGDQHVAVAVYPGVVHHADGEGGAGLTHRDGHRGRHHHARVVRGQAYRQFAGGVAAAHQGGCGRIAAGGFADCRRIERQVQGRADGERRRRQRGIVGLVEFEHRIARIHPDQQLVAAGGEGRQGDAFAAGNAAAPGDGIVGIVELTHQQGVGEAAIGRQEDLFGPPGGHVLVAAVGNCPAHRDAVAGQTIGWSLDVADCQVRVRCQCRHDGQRRLVVAFAVAVGVVFVDRMAAVGGHAHQQIAGTAAAIRQGEAGRQALAVAGRQGRCADPLGGEHFAGVLTGDLHVVVIAARHVGIAGVNVAPLHHERAAGSGGGSAQVVDPQIRVAGDDTAAADGSRVVGFRRDTRLVLEDLAIQVGGDLETQVADTVAAVGQVEAVGVVDRLAGADPVGAGGIVVEGIGIDHLTGSLVGHPQIIVETAIDRRIAGVAAIPTDRHCGAGLPAGRGGRIQVVDSQVGIGGERAGGGDAGGVVARGGAGGVVFVDRAAGIGGDLNAQIADARHAVRQTQVEGVLDIAALRHAAGTGWVAIQPLIGQ